jgi:hypothetical protein
VPTGWNIAGWSNSPTRSGVRAISPLVSGSKGLDASIRQAFVEPNRFRRNNAQIARLAGPLLPNRHARCMLVTPPCRATPEPVDGAPARASGTAPRTSAAPRSICTSTAGLPAVRRPPVLGVGAAERPDDAANHRDRQRLDMPQSTRGAPRHHVLDEDPFRLRQATVKAHRSYSRSGTTSTSMRWTWAPCPQ